MNIILNLTKYILLIFFSSHIFAKDLIIEGNNYSDDEIIISIIGDISTTDDKTKSNLILKQLNNSGLFKSVEVFENEKNYIINVVENPSISKIYFNNNERLKDDDLNSITKELNVNIYSDKIINKLIDEFIKIYQSFGYNNVQIKPEIKYLDNNSVELSLNFNEGEITKIKNIIFDGNLNYDDSVLASKIKSKIKKITNIFANNNFKLFQINNDTLKIVNFYKSQGYKNVNVLYEVEYSKDNKVIINFKIDEGKKFFISSIKIDNLLKTDNVLNDEINKILNKENNKEKFIYNSNNIDEIEFSIVRLLEKNGLEFFEIQTLERINNNEQIDILFKIVETKPQYLKQINIYGNTRTYDYVIRRELDVVEGDAINKTKIKLIKKQLNRMGIFSDVKVTPSDSISTNKDLDIEVEETQTGSFNVGLSIGTFDGISFISGLKEKNINGTGRSVEFLLNTSEDNKAFTLSTTEKLFFNSKIDHKYSANYKENDYSKSKSYKSNTLILDTDFTYVLAQNLFHTYGIGYQLKDYTVTDSSTVSDSIANSAGETISFNIKSELTFNSLNSFIRPSTGNYYNFSNYLQTPSSSSNGYVKNTFLLKKYLEQNQNIYSFQARIGNIYSLNDAEILSDDKFSLGGKWLRGFDSFGAGPRNSRTAYVGGNNIIAAKLDYSKPVTLNDQNPIYLNLFNDYGLVWGNKNTVTSSNNSIRASYGFGINYYSPIGPIGFSWGFPLSDEEYDIKRMFMFTIGNLN